jgi:hypothetical protein
MHTIRLGDPWEQEPIAGATRYRRRFGQPTNLARGQQVHLVLDGFDPLVQVALNAQTLSPTGRNPWRFDVTDRLAFRNELVIDLPLGALLGDVRLEIAD